MFNFLLPSGKRNKKLVLDFSDETIKIAYLEHSFNTFKLIAHDTKKFRDEADFSGQQLSHSETITFIKGFLKKNSISVQDVILSVSEIDALYIKYLDLPDLPLKEIHSAAKWQLKEDAPFDLEKALFDFQIIRIYTDEEGVNKKGVIAIALQKETAEEYLSLLFELHLTPEAITSSFFNYANILKHTPKLPPTVAILDIDEKNSRLGIYLDHKLVFVRELPFSIEKLTLALTRVLVTDKGKIALTLQDAIDIRNSIGIPQEENQMINEKIQAIHVISLMRPLLETLVREIKFSFNYFSSHLNLEIPSQILLTNSGANLENINFYLKKELSIDIAQLPLPHGVSTAQISKNESHTFTSVIGASLEDPLPINLLPLEIKSKRMEFLQLASLRVLAVSLVAIFSFLLFILEFQIQSYNKRINLAKIHISLLQNRIVKKEQYSQKEALLEKIQKKEISFSGILKSIAQVIPDEIFLDEMSFSKDNASITLKGKIFTTDENVGSRLTNFTGQLEDFPFFTETQLVSSKLVGTYEEFEFKCDLAH